MKNKNTDEMIHDHMMGRSWGPFLYGTVTVFGCFVSLLVIPYIFGYRLLSPKIAATYAELNGTTPPPETEVQWLNWIIVFVLLLVGAPLLMWFIGVARVAESGIEMVDGEYVGEDNSPHLLKSGK